MFVPEPVEPVRSGAPLPGRGPATRPVQLGALLVGLVVASGDLANKDLRIAGVFLVLVAYTAVTTARPIPYRDDRPTPNAGRPRRALPHGCGDATGDWKSPFSFTLIPSTLLAGFASGPLYSIQLVGAAAGVDLGQVPVGRRHPGRHPRHGGMVRDVGARRPDERAVAAGVGGIGPSADASPSTA